MHIHSLLWLKNQPEEILNNFVGAIITLGLSTIVAATQASNQLPSGGILQRGQYIESTEKKYSLHMQSDGSLVMYRQDGTVRYRMAKHGYIAYMQADGNFVEYSPFNEALWHTVTGGQWGGNFLQIQDDGNLVVFRPGWIPAWNIGTEPSPNDPTLVGDVVGRDLAVTGAGPLGHLGLWDGQQVVEATGGLNNAIRFVTLNTFKNQVAPEAYWGKASPNIPAGTIARNCYSTYCHSNGIHHLEVESRDAITRRAYQQYLLGADYTLSTSYKAGLFATQVLPASRGLFRCDTFMISLLAISTEWKDHPTPAQLLWTRRHNTLYEGMVTPTAVFNKLKTFY
jgi:hypothetical protein